MPVFRTQTATSARYRLISHRQILTSAKIPGVAAAQFSAPRDVRAPFTLPFTPSGLP